MAEILFSRQSEYILLGNMKKRCYSKSNDNYGRYGSIGVTICKEWLNDTQLFIDWCRANGYKKGLQIDRIDNNRGYSPENCRFVTRSENQQNTRLLRKTNTSGYRGVSASRGLWVATITNNGKQKHLGRFKTKKEAAQAYNKYVTKNNTHHPLNIIK